MRNKFLRGIPKNIALSAATGFVYTIFDYWRFNHNYPNSPVVEESELWQILKSCRNELNIPKNIHFATTSRRVLAASSWFVFPMHSKIALSEKELRKLSKKTNLSTEQVTRAIVAHEAAHINENHKLLTVSASIFANRIAYDLIFLIRYSGLVRHVGALLMFTTTNLILTKACEYRADYVAAQHDENTREDLTKIFQAISNTPHSIFSAHPTSEKRLKHINSDLDHTNSHSNSK